MTRYILPAFLATALAAQQAQAPYAPTEEEKSRLIARLTELGKRISLIRAADHDPALLHDVEIYHKAAAWLLRHPEEFYTRAYLTNALMVVDRGLDRARWLEKGEAPWTARRGRVAFAYRSRVDDSLQPYQVVIPDSLELISHARLDVVLHGRGATLSEVSFLAAAEAAKPGAATYGDRLELHVFGRTNNAYRWSGETDVFEALAAVESRFKIDTNRIVLRGFSMGGAGAWHIGLHHPHRWAAIEAGAGFTETVRYAKQASLPSWIEKTLRIYDATDYSRNAFNVPTVGYGGELDPQLQASVNIKERLATEGFRLPDLRALFLIGPKTEHKFHADSKRESDAFLDRFVAAGRKEPAEIKFVTYTARYNKAYRVSVDELERHYERTEVDASGSSYRTRNVARLTISVPGAVEIDGQKFPVAGPFTKRDGRWEEASPPTGLRKRHGLQGPIDDAFLDSFLCVRPTGKPMHDAPSRRAKDALARFSDEFAKWLRADPRTVDDRDVTDAHVRDHHLILFGDPSSNAVLRRIAPKLPVRWDRKTIQAGGKTFAAASHLLVMIYPNPLNPNKYVVLNSGHTFGESEFRGTNALLFPRLGDWAVLTTNGEVAAAGLFDDNWRVP